MKKLINDPRNVVREMLEGQMLLHAKHALLENENVVVRADLPSDPLMRPVALISGGGSGHEPAHAGYVGAGMLSAAVVGDVFTSPSVDAVLAAIRSVAGPRGAILIVKNYTGDRLNFGLAAEMATAEGIPTKVVVVADDVALRDTVAPERRRGIAGTVFVHKIAGAAAAGGMELADVWTHAHEAATAVGSMGVALGSCTVPAAGKPGFSLGDDEMELGLGIHGEQGVSRARIQPVDDIVDTIISRILDDKGLETGSRVALLVNGLGGTPPMELAIAARRALRGLAAKGIKVERVWAGEFMTALEMPGLSLSLIALDDQRLALLDEVTDAPAWPGKGMVAPERIVPDQAIAALSGKAEAGPLAGQLRAAGLAVALALEESREHLTELDSRAGDGDLGVSMVRGAAAIRALPAESWANPAVALAEVGHAMRRAIAGSSGPFYATALLRASRELDEEIPDDRAWAMAFAHAVAAVGELGGARPGDRTMLDALQPAADAFVAAIDRGSALTEAWQVATKAAEDGAARTAGMLPKLGRAAYLGERALGSPDAGASAVLVWMQALAQLQRER